MTVFSILNTPTHIYSWMCETDCLERDQRDTKETNIHVNEARDNIRPTRKRAPRADSARIPARFPSARAQVRPREFVRVNTRNNNRRPSSSNSFALSCPFSSLPFLICRTDRVRIDRPMLRSFERRNFRRCSVKIVFPSNPPFSSPSAGYLLFPRFPPSPELSRDEIGWHIEDPSPPQHIFLSFPRNQSLPFSLRREGGPGSLHPLSFASFPAKRAAALVKRTDRPTSSCFISAKWQYSGRARARAPLPLISSIRTHNLPKLERAAGINSFWPGGGRGGGTALRATSVRCRARLR